MKTSLRNMVSSISSPVESRLFAEYGAIFVTAATPPPVIMFSDSSEVEEFQSSLRIGGGVFWEHYIELQFEAMKSLIRAADEIAIRGGSLTARASDAGRRSYDETVGLWTRNVSRGLDHWENLGLISPDRARIIRELTPADQVAVILELEAMEQLYFGTFFDKSILYSVAAPGASQHLSMLAFDVAEYQDETLELTLNRFGWHRTVVNDLPHFTFLGYPEEALGELGLKRVEHGYGPRSYHFWVLDLD